MWKEKSSTERSCGGKDCSWWVTKIGFSKETVIWGKRGKRVRDSWRDFGLNLSIFIQMVNLWNRGQRLEISTSFWHRLTLPRKTFLPSMAMLNYQLSLIFFKKYWCAVPEHPAWDPRAVPASREMAASPRRDGRQRRLWDQPVRWQADT